MSATDEFDAATARAAKRLATEPRAVEARYDAGTGYVLVRLSTGLGVFFAPADVQDLEGATPADLEEIEIDPPGFGLHFPRIDADLYLPALLRGEFGSKSWMAARFGRTGGAARSEAEAAAGRSNGRLGGRPRRSAARG
jgi:hypothetical protein